MRQALQRARRARASRSPAARASRAAGELERQHDVLQRGQRGHQMKRLEHEAHALGAQRARGRPRRARSAAHRRATLRPRSADPAPRAAPAASICRRPKAPRSPPTRRGRWRMRPSRTMVSGPSGLLTCLLRLRASRTMSRVMGILLALLVALAAPAVVAADSGGPGASTRAPGDPGVWRQPQRGLRHPRRAGLGEPAGAKDRARRVRIPRGERQRERRDHRRRACAPAARAGAAAPRS